MRTLSPNRRTNRAMSECLESRLLLTSVVVNTTLDGIFPPSSGLVSLRNAVMTADGNVSPTTITFDPKVFANPQTIVLNGTELDVNNSAQSIAIVGPVAGVTISGNNVSRVF